MVTLALFMVFLELAHPQHVEPSMNFQNQADHLMRKSKEMAKEGNYKEAVSLLSTIKMIEGIEKSQVADALKLRGEIFFQQKKYKYALPDFDQAFSFNSFDMDLLALRAKSFFHLNMCPQFKKDLKLLKSKKYKDQTNELASMETRCNEQKEIPIN